LTDFIASSFLPDNILHQLLINILSNLGLKVCESEPAGSDSLRISGIIPSMSNFIFVIVLVLSTGRNFGQAIHNPLHSLDDERRFIYGIDNRRTHIRNQNTLIYGIYCGYSYGHQLRYKFSVSGTPFERGKFVDAQGLLLRQRLIFASIGEEFDFLVIRRFRLTSYFQAGAGFNFFRRIDAAANELERGRRFIIPIEIGFHQGYELNPWLQLKLGGGWRFVLPETSRDLSGYYIKIGLAFSGIRFWQAHGDKILKMKNEAP
jgi:hypothetical protein